MHFSSETSPAPKNRRRLCPDAPADFGLRIEFLSGCICRMEFVPDKHLEEIHPNAYGPASLTDLSCLGGGGSGVRVFEGFDAELGRLVMKHGGYKDSRELFALATIAQELKIRNEEAGQRMQARIPEFRMLYVSPRHLRDTPKELWEILSIAVREMFHNNSSEESLPSLALNDDVSTRSGDTDIGSDTSQHRPKTVRKNGRMMRLYTCMTGDTVEVSLPKRRMDMILGADRKVEMEPDKEWSLLYGAPDQGFVCLRTFLHELGTIQKKRLWKFTQAQKTIGGPNAKTGAAYLAEGKLSGAILDTLLREYISAIRDLQRLTLPEEKIVVEQVRAEVEAIDVHARPIDISDTADAFVGLAIKKNWHPNTGRFFRLRRMGADFRSNNLVLTEREELPARLLGTILQEGSCMSDVFHCSHNTLSALDTKGSKMDTWRILLKDAVSLQASATVDRVWNCGLADGGLHNLFLSEDYVWFFDLGEPSLQPLPAFLTKFLFSFLHTLGMVDDKVHGGWVNRFIPGEKLSPTPETEILLPKAYDALKVALDRIIEVLFDGEEAVRGLLINYMTLQLLSDAAFCLERWTTKGGGKPRTQNHHKNIEQWLWRALWDIFAASDLNTKRRLYFLCAQMSRGSHYAGAM